MKRMVAIMFIIPVLWFTGAKPFIGEIRHCKYLKTIDVNQLKSAINWDSENTQYLTAAAFYYIVRNNCDVADQYMNKAIATNNGDSVPWALYYNKAMLQLKTNKVSFAKINLAKALSYNPNFKQARNQYDFFKHNKGLYIR